MHKQSQSWWTDKLQLVLSKKAAREFNLSWRINNHSLCGLINCNQGNFKSSSQIQQEWGTVKPKDLFMEMVLCFCMFFFVLKKFFRSIFGEPSPGAQRRRWLYKNTYNTLSNKENISLFLFFLTVCWMLEHLSHLWQQTLLPPTAASLIFFNLDNHFPSLAFFIPFSPIIFIY